MSYKRATRSYLLLPFIILCACVSARSQTLVSARILSSSGAVEIQRRPQGQPAFTKIDYRVNDELRAGDVIKTARGGRLVLGLADGSQAIISEKTTVEILDLSRTPRTIFNVLRGKTRVKIEKVGGRPNPYRVNTPTAVIAVRGTLFDVLVSEKETQVFVHEGQVAVSSLSAPDAPVILDPGQKTRVPQSDSPEAPSAFKWGRNNEAFGARLPTSGPGSGGQNGGQQNGNPPRDGGPNNQPSSPPRNPPDNNSPNGPGHGGGGGGRHP